MITKNAFKKKYDAIVVGTGPGGATVAKELSKQKKNVLMLERGRNIRPKDSILGFASVTDPVQIGEGLQTVRALTTGGTTALYFAVAEIPPLDTFLSLGIDISKELEDVKNELSIAELPDNLLGLQAIKARESAIQLGLPWKKHMMLVDQSKCVSGYSHEAMWRARNYVQEALENGATLINSAFVEKIIVEKNRAVGVEYKIWKTGKKSSVHQVYGRKVVLAAGALASPVILCNSGLDDVVNHGFYCNPSTTLFGVIPGLKGGDNFAGNMGFIQDDSIAIGDGNLSRTYYRILMLANKKYFRLFCHSDSIAVGVVVRDRSGGQLSGNNTFYKNLAEEDFSKLDKGEAIAEKIITNAGGIKIFKSGLVSAGVGGTVSMTKHLDKTLQTKINHLYVCDGSIIPDYIRVSPTLTLICLGKYLSKQLLRAF